GVTVAAAAAVAASPTPDSFEAATLEAAGALLLLSPGTRSPRADRHVQRLLRRRAAGRLRYQNLLFLAVVYETPHPPPTAALYRACCRYLRPRWRELPGRLLDVGFAGRWWVLGARLRDCDVNEEEFQGLPERLRRVETHHLRSHRNESLFLEKFRPVILTPEEIRNHRSQRGRPGRAPTAPPRSPKGDWGARSARQHPGILICNCSFI
ncbi:LOW QUALITY PROTEIN: mitochondrial import inner membrane translocase subunit Tim29-like, partial [Rissa tridactyla]|uniref:LOW QUALITY PROTEIN: mitochondrial import inner membrane translocase subunit Tim29-like n=1 Tax=Rissa tridactyla TaxID=75485 RepID=UPI0023BAD76F